MVDPQIFEGFVEGAEQRLTCAPLEMDGWCLEQEEQTTRFPKYRSTRSADAPGFRCS